MLHSLWILAATFFTVLTYVFVKWVPPQYEIWDIFFVRSCYMAFFAVLWRRLLRRRSKQKSRRRILAERYAACSLC